MRYATAVANHLGNRSVNQDRFAIVETSEGVLLALADGMGGMPQGERAAQILIDTAREHYLQAARPLGAIDSFFTGIIQDAHQRLLHLSDMQNGGSIPGTTAVLALLQHGRLDWAHVGDSRLYLFRNGLPVFRTQDHSFVEQLCQQGRIRRSECERHPRRHSITQCVGGLPHMPKVEIGKGKRLEIDDIVLLCSDGLWGALDDAQLGLMLRRGQTLEAALEAMATRAEQNSYPHSDNISAVALRLLALQAAQAGQTPTVAVTPPPDAARLEDAIAQIEAAWRIYKDEL